MESCEVHPWPGGKGCELFHHFHLGYLDCGGAVVPGFFESVNDLASDIEGKPFFITNVQKKKGTDAPPHLYDLTSLQVDCNKKFGYSAETTLNIIQSLYEKKFTTYPRVDTQYLSDDIYPKCPQILNGVSQCKIDSQPKYLELVKNLAAISAKLPKSKKVFDD